MQHITRYDDQDLERAMCGITGSDGASLRLAVWDGHDDHVHAERAAFTLCDDPSTNVNEGSHRWLRAPVPNSHLVQ